MELEPITHLEKSIAGTVAPVTHLEKVIEQYGGGGGGGAVSSVNGKTGAVVLNAEDVGGAQESLKLTATPTVGPSGTTLMGGTWSGATWEEVVAAIQASRLIQADVTNIGKITLLYNMDSATKALSNAFAYIVNGILYSVFIELQIDDGVNLFLMSIINARTETVNISGTTPTITPAANTTYNCGELTSLTISNPPANGAYSIVFTSGATATTTTIPATILGLEDFAAEANTIYEINVLDNRAVVGKWMEPGTGRVEIVPWSTGTDEQIAAMVAALDVGKITIADTGWHVGDERTVSLAAMEATGVGESHAAQSVTMVLMDSQHYDLVAATAGGSTKDHFVVGLKNCLNEPGYMNSTTTNIGSWNACARRAWCNEVFKAAIPQTLRNCFKQFQVITATAVDSTVNQTTNDYFALFAEKEVFGERTFSNETEAAALTQIEYYETAANRIKTVDGSAGGWWERSPVSSKGGTGSFGIVGGGGGASSGSAGYTNGLAPFGCI